MTGFDAVIGAALSLSKLTASVLKGEHPQVFGEAKLIRSMAERCGELRAVVGPNHSDWKRRFRNKLPMVDIVAFQGKATRSPGIVRF